MLAALRRRPSLAWPLLACLSLYLNACVAYSAREIPKDEPVLVDAGKQLLLHQDGRTLSVERASVDARGLRGIARELPVSRGVPRQPGKGQRVDLWLESGADSLRAGAGLALPWDQVAKITVYDRSVGKTLLIWTAGTLGVLAIAFIIFLLTKSSCPFVYADPGGGGEFDFQGEIFSGAIYRQLERDDWMPLPAPRGGTYRVRITNEVKEIQHLDAAALLLARHPAGTGVLLDAAGRPHTFAAPQAPLRCVTSGGRDASALLAARDSLAWMGGEGTAESGWAEGVDLAFARPAGARAAKLIVRGKNSFWLDYLYGRFQDLFGDGLERWNGKMRAAPRAKLEAWFREQKLPLSVELKGPRGWEEIASLNLPGPMAARDFLVPFALPGGDAPVELRLRCGFLFWELDYAALDFSPDAPVALVPVAPDTAVDQNGKDLRPALASSDGLRYDQPSVGDAASLSFRVPPAPEGMGQSAFLATRGYYDILREAKGRPRTAELKGFRQPGALARFSAETMRARIGGGADGH